MERLSMALITGDEKMTRRGQRGMTLIEVMISMVILLVGLVASLGLVSLAIGTNGRNRQQSNATVLAQMVSEKISSIPPSSTTALTITDCSGLNWTVNNAAGGSTLLASGAVDYTQAQVANYSMNYVACGTNGRAVTYDVRWNVQQPSSYVSIVTVSARQRGATSNELVFSFPVTIRTMIGIGF